MSQLAITLDAAVKAQMSEVHSHVDFTVSAECVRLHFGAIEGPADGKPDKRSTGQLRYCSSLKRHRIEVPVIEKAVESLLGDSLGDTFLHWSAGVIAQHPRISTADIARRLQEIMVFTGMCSLAATEAQMDSLVAAEEAARVVLDKELVRYTAATAKAKDRLRRFQAAYDDAGKARVWRSGTTDEINSLNIRVGDDVRQSVRLAWSRHVQRTKYPTRNRKDTTKESAPEPTSAETSESETTATEGDTK